MIGPHVSRDAEGPRVEAAVGAERVAVLEDANEHVLDEVFGHRPVARHARQVVEQLAVVALEQGRQARRVAGAHGKHQVLVGHWATR